MCLREVVGIQVGAAPPNHAGNVTVTVRCHGNREINLTTIYGDIYPPNPGCAQVVRSGYYGNNSFHYGPLDGGGGGAGGA